MAEPGAPATAAVGAAPGASAPLPALLGAPQDVAGVQATLGAALAGTLTVQMVYLGDTLVRGGWRGAAQPMTDPTFGIGHRSTRC